MHNAELLFKEDCTVDDLIDVIEVGAAGRGGAGAGGREGGGWEREEGGWAGMRNGPRPPFLIVMNATPRSTYLG